MFRQERGPIFDGCGRTLAFSAAEDGVYVRCYAAPSLSHVVGYFHERYGITGLERLYQEELSQGRSLFTTLDLELQKRAEELLQGVNGAVVALRPATGEVLALVSSPWVDGSALDENWPDYLADVRSPFLNRATQGLYPPGSTVKPIVYWAAAALGRVDDETSWSDPGVLNLPGGMISNAGGRAHGQISIAEALAYSSNVVFAELAVDLEEQLLKCFRLFGLGQQIDFELGNLEGFVPAGIASPYHAAQLGIGQGELLVTPLQMAQAAAALANGGILMRPYLVKELRGGLRLRQITRPQVVQELLPKSAANTVRKAMALAAREGTAQTHLSGSLDYAGKTGTAQTGRSAADHAWFIGFAPVDAPQVAVAVVIEHGGAGAAAAAPVGAEIMLKALQMSE
jgi:peptidoglycan glycosyltransferase